MITHVLLHNPIFPAFLYNNFWSIDINVNNLIFVYVYRATNLLRPVKCNVCQMIFNSDLYVQNVNCWGSKNNTC